MSLLCFLASLRPCVLTSVQLIQTLPEYLQRDIDVLVIHHQRRRQAQGVLPRGEKEQALREYGFNLGIAFQLVDDLLDFTGDAQAVGKPLASDLREGKVTLPLIHLLRQSNDGEGSRIVRDAIASHSVSPEQWNVLLRMLKEHASIDYAYRRAVEYAERAKQPLYAFPSSSERDALLALPDYVLSRDR